MSNGRVVTHSLPWGFRAYPTKLHDGDSFWMMFDCGFGVRAEAEIRLDGVHAPEVHPMQPGGQETADFVLGWFAQYEAAAKGRRWPFWAEIVMTTTYEPQMDESFTRYVGTVWPFEQRDQPGLDLNAAVRAFLAEHPDWGSGD